MVKYLDNQNSGFNQWLNNQKNTAKKPSKFSGFFWWLIIFILSWWLISSWFGPKKDNIEKTSAGDTFVENISNVPVSKIDSDKVDFNVKGLRISDIQLKDYNKEKNTKENVSLLSGDKDYIEIGLIASGTTAPTAKTVWNDKFDMVWRNSDGIEFKRIVSVKDYVITVVDQIKNNSAKDVSFSPYARIVRQEQVKTKSVAVATGAIAYVNDDISRKGWNNLDKKSYAYQTTTGFAGFADQYWETIASLNSPDHTILMKKTDNMYQADSSAAPVNIAAGKTVNLETKIFAGPRDQNILSIAEKSISGIDQTMDYGWFWFLARPMLWALNALNNLVLNYGLAIILLTVALRLLMWPLTRKSYASMAAMQKMQPELQRIQKLYAKDKMRLQMEMMKLYQTHKTSPMSGCLPMLLQIPIFFALY